MTDPRTESLRKWNELARENTENAIVSSMFEAAAKASEPIEIFATWLLVGAAAVASFLITNADKLVPLVTKRGFLVCGAFLCLSCVLGLLSKIFALRARIGRELGAAVRNDFLGHLSKYKEEEKRIKDSAESGGIKLETGIRVERVLTEFYKPFPRVTVWLMKRHFQKHAGNPQIGYLLLMRNLQLQGFLAFFQAVSFLSFLIAGFIYSAAP
jgi:hypothetical protein